MIIVILIIAVLIIGTFSFFSYLESRKQTAIQEKQTALLAKEQAKTPEDKSATTNVGKSAIARSTAVDLQSNTKAQVGVPAYFYTRNQDGTFKEYVGQSGTRTLSASDSTSVTPVNIGDRLCGRAFNATGGVSGTVGYYGDEKCIDIKVGGETLRLEVDRICRTNQMQGYLKTNLNALGQNLTAGASQANSFETLELRVNGTDCAYNLGGFYVDIVSTASNIQDVGMGEVATKGATTAKVMETNKNLKRLTAVDDYVFELDKPILMKEYETVKTGSFTILADGDGCSTAEGVNVTAFDVSGYQSVTDDKLPLLSGIEDDQTSPVDVGGADIPIVSSGRGTSGTNTVNADGTTSFYCIP